jgi:hypothetical protein
MRLAVLVFIAALLVPSRGWSLDNCVVYGKVYRTGGAINLELNSTCGIRVDRTRSFLVLTSHYRTVEIQVPRESGVYPFLYEWGQNTATFGEEEVDISFGPAGES